MYNNIIRGVNGSFRDHQLIILEPLLESHSSCPKVSAMKTFPQITERLLEFRILGTEKKLLLWEVHKWILVMRNASLQKSNSLMWKARESIAGDRRTWYFGQIHPSAVRILSVSQTASLRPLKLPVMTITANCVRKRPELTAEAHCCGRLPILNNSLSCAFI